MHNKHQNTEHRTLSSVDDTSCNFSGEPYFYDGTSKRTLPTAIGKRQNCSKSRPYMANITISEHSQDKIPELG
jgi:hypothetical protein